MKTKLTLTIDDELIPRAKRYAKAKGTSLSAIVELALRRVTTGPSQPSFSKRWRGRLSIKAGDDARYRVLAERYDL
jgi:hypothetical protein